MGCSVSIPYEYSKCRTAFIDIVSWKPYYIKGADNGFYGEDPAQIPYSQVSSGIHEYSAGNPVKYTNQN